jgi:Putative phage holin Dp-1
MITGKLYDWLKWIAQVFLPALGTLYFSIDSAWGLGSGTQVVGTIMAVDLFLGVLLGISQINYGKQIENAGDLIVDKDGNMSFQIDGDTTDVDALADKKEVRFTVKNELEGDTE